MRGTSLFVVGGVLGASWLAGCNRCQRDDPPPPLPTSTVDAAVTPTVLDAGAPELDAAADADAATDAKAPKAQPAPSLKPCCDALASNAENAPEPTKTYMKQAAAACHAAIAQGKDKNSILAVVRGALGGAGLPAACR